MTTYYWESDNNSGKFDANNDVEAISKIRQEWIVVYKESDSTDGQPFIVIHEKRWSQG